MTRVSPPVENGDQIKFSVSGPASSSGPAALISSVSDAQQERALPARWFIPIWFAIVLLHSLCAVLLIFMGRVYAFIQIPRMVYWAKLFGDRTDNPFFKISECTFTAIGAIHCLQVASILWFSLRARELVFRPAVRRRGTKISTFESLHLHLEKSLVSNRSRLSRCLIRVIDKAVVWVWKKITNQGLVSDEAKLLLKIAAQSYQVYRFNNLLSRIWINSLVVSLLVLNCWSPSILQRLLKAQHPALERFARLLVDALLSIASNFLVPLTVFWPYYSEFIVDLYSFPPDLSYDSIWFTRLFLEVKMLLALSTLDLVTKLINQFSIHSSLVLATALIRRQPACKKSRRSSTIIDKIKPTKRSSCKSLCLHVVYVLVGLWGIALIVIHARAIHRINTPMNGCMNTHTPWFSTKYPCSAFNFNCYRHGVESPIDSDLDALDQETLKFLIFTHCPTMRMPAEIQNFPSILGLQLHNCTIQSWSRESAVSATKHTKMITIVMTRTNMTEFPEGLLGPLPASLADIQISISNLTSLTEDFNALWHPLSVFYLEFSQLKEIPSSFFQLPVMLASFVGNQIHYLPPLDHVHTFYYILDLGKNPIQTLPTTIGAGTYIWFLNVERSNLTTAPSWISTNVRRPYFCGSPYCDQQNQVISTSINAGCGHFDPLGGGRLPVWVIDSILRLLLQLSLKFPLLLSEKYVKRVFLRILDFNFYSVHPVNAPLTFILARHGSSTQARSYSDTTRAVAKIFTIATLASLFVANAYAESGVSDSADQERLHTASDKANGITNVLLLLNTYACKADEAICPKRRQS